MPPKKNPLKEALQVVETTLPPWTHEWARYFLGEWQDADAEDVPDTVQEFAQAMLQRYQNQFPAPLLQGLQQLGTNFGPGAVVLAAATLQQWPVYHRLVPPAPESHEAELAKALEVDPATGSWANMLELVHLLQQQDSAAEAVLDLHGELATALGHHRNTTLTWQELIKEVRAHVG
jgi:hypothetical protein